MDVPVPAKESRISKKGRQGFSFLNHTRKIVQFIPSNYKHPWLAPYSHLVCLARMYRLNTGEGGLSSGTKTLSVSNGSSSPVPVITELTPADQQLHHGGGSNMGGSQWRLSGAGTVDQMYRQSHGYNFDMMSGGMSHSYTLPHSLSHHSSNLIMGLNGGAEILKSLNKKG